MIPFLFGSKYEGIILIMNSIFSDQLSDFADIYSDDIEIIGIDRPNFDLIETLASEFIETKEDLKIQWVQATNDIDPANNILPMSIDPDLRSLITDQISESSKMLGELMGCNKVGVRLATLRSPMCPSFHVDQIPCRLLITLCGEGTEWISNQDVDLDIFFDISNKNIPIKNNRSIQQIKTGQWSLLKGSGWNNKYQGLVHRSPHETEARLLLSLDPIFDQ